MEYEAGCTHQDDVRYSAKPLGKSLAAHPAFTKLGVLVDDLDEWGLGLALGLESCHVTRSGKIRQTPPLCEAQVCEQANGQSANSQSMRLEHIRDSGTHP